MNSIVNIKSKMNAVLSPVINTSKSEPINKNKNKDKYNFLFLVFEK